MWMTCTGICRHRLGCPLMEIAICCCWWGRRASWIFIARSITAAESTQGQRPNETNQRPRWWRPPASRRGRSIESVASLLIDGSIDGSSLALWPAVFHFIVCFFRSDLVITEPRLRAPCTRSSFVLLFFGSLSLSLLLLPNGRLCCCWPFLSFYFFVFDRSRPNEKPSEAKKKKKRERERERGV